MRSPIGKAASTARPAMVALDALEPLLANEGRLRVMTIWLAVLFSVAVQIAPQVTGVAVSPLNLVVSLAAIVFAALLWERGERRLLRLRLAKLRLAAVMAADDPADPTQV